MHTIFESGSAGMANPSRTCHCHTYAKRVHFGRQPYLGRNKPWCQPSERAQHRRAAQEQIFPEDLEYIEDLQQQAETDAIAAMVDEAWSELPLGKLRREGEIGWSIDTDGPTGPEKLDNVYHKEQSELNRKAIRIVGMGSWRLKAFVSETLQLLVANLEGAWRHLIDDLALYPIKPAYLYLDSMDPDQEYGDWSYADIESPEKGDSKWPRMQIENRCYRNREFRKLHMEVAHRQDGLEVLHCVMFPNAEYDLPIMSMDVVAKDGIISLGIIDPCPGRLDGTLPEAYNSMVSTLQETYGLTSNRAIPEWGKSIFSEHCVMMRPTSGETLETFMRYAVALVRLHLRFANASEPITETESSRLRDIKDAHRRYSQQHLKNSKTKRVLATSFGDKLAEEYMTKVMFDTAGA